MAKKNAQGTKTLAEVQAQVEAALKLLSSEQADQLIGKQTTEYQTLIVGVRAVMGMYWATMKAMGLRETPESLKAGAQALLMVAALVHYAYALGIRRGRESTRPPIEPTDKG